MSRKPKDKEPEPIQLLKPEDLFVDFGPESNNHVPVPVAVSTLKVNEIFVDPKESPPEPNVVEYDNYSSNASTPLSQLMNQSAEAVCPICGKALPLNKHEVRDTVINGEIYLACKGCYVSK